MAKPINVGEIQKKLTVEEFDALLEDYKKINPVKYKLKLENGEFEVQRKQCLGYQEPKAKSEEKKVK